MARSADELMEEVFGSLGPSEDQSRRMAAALDAQFERPAQSLAAEWAELLRIRPLWHVTLSAASALVFVFGSPRGAAALLLARAR
jgi:hypothetical protein